MQTQGPIVSFIFNLNSFAYACTCICMHTPIYTCIELRMYTSALKTCPPGLNRLWNMSVNTCNECGANIAFISLIRHPSSSFSFFFYDFSFVFPFPPSPESSRLLLLLLFFRLCFLYRSTVWSLNLHSKLNRIFLTLREYCYAYTSGVAVYMRRHVHVYIHSNMTYSNMYMYIHTYI